MNTMRIHFKKIYTIKGSVNAVSSDSTYSFVIKDKSKNDIEVKLILSENSVIASCPIECENDFVAILEDKDKILLNHPVKLIEISDTLNNAVYRVLSILKYCLNNTEIDEKLYEVDKFEWVDDTNIWHDLPKRTNLTPDMLNTTLRLNSKTSIAIQRYLDEEFYPFVALKHLHRAKVEQIPKYKWVEATIAAELAIKEFFIRFEPKFEALLLELPSPPIDKLYGSILEKYTGERSPSLKSIREGMKKRNELLHRPTENESVTFEEAVKYVKSIEAAIYHLLQLLYKDDPLIKDYGKNENRITSAIKIHVHTE